MHSPIHGPRPFVEQNRGLDPRRDDLFFAAATTTRTPMLVADARLPDYPIIFANDAFRKLTGYTDAEIYGRNCRFLQGPDTDLTALADLRVALKEGREFAAEVLNYRKDKTTFWNELFIAPIFTEENELVYFFASQVDVSRRHEAEEGLHQARKMEALGQLAGGVAHDFNNLLQVMVGYVDLLDLSVKTDARDETILKNIAKIRGAVKTASSLTQQMLLFARKQVLVGRTVNLNGICDDLLELARHTLGDTISIRTEFASDLRNCQLDVGQLEMAMLNIILNARDALSGQTDAQVLLRTDNFELTKANSTGLVDLPEGRYVTLSITDNGTGMTPEVAGKVLTPFFTTKGRGKGTGLGLSMVASFARQTGGALTISSDYGVGSTLTFYFPSVDVAEEASQDTSHVISQRGTEKVLIVDDRRDVGEVAQAMLDEMGYSTKLALNAADALAILASDEAFDLLFTDFVMPGALTGAGLAREAKRLKPELRVLVATGYAETIEDIADANGVRFKVIHKPYRQADLAREVRLVLDDPRWR
ncbi:histidine kinase famiy protein [Caballeronia sp. LP006]|uniref:histidine kinase famiy protein n=1 Tax=Caballeronia sp. LP006 TaxID=3038552 RepID=UPI002862187E|nr:histidine kinase famiy protein [Caballeronia sp. LP006]MDR5827448.1 histidine kinase famiy protein [Caballeronia sp. LP006]